MSTGSDPFADHYDDPFADSPNDNFELNNAERAESSSESAPKETSPLHSYRDIEQLSPDQLPSTTQRGNEEDADHTLSGPEGDIPFEMAPDLELDAAGSAHSSTHYASTDEGQVSTQLESSTLSSCQPHPE